MPQKRENFRPNKKFFVERGTIKSWGIVDYIMICCWDENECNGDIIQGVDANKPFSVQSFDKFSLISFK